MRAAHSFLRILICCSVAALAHAESLDASARRAVDNAVAGKVPSDTTKLLFSSGTTRNPQQWARGWNWTGVSSSKPAVTLISPENVIGANHWFPGIGDKVTFVKANGETIQRTISDSRDITGTDIKVARLDAPLPEAITYYPLLTPEVRKKKLRNVAGTPIIYSDGESKALLGAITDWGDGWAGLGIYSRHPTWFEFPISGDSGSPLFMPINAKRIALYTTFDSELGGPDFAAYIPQINAALAAMGGRYRVTPVNVNKFRSF
jgi:hypothetical protein